MSPLCNMGCTGSAPSSAGIAVIISHVASGAGAISFVRSMVAGKLQSGPLPAVESRPEPPPTTSAPVERDFPDDGDDRSAWESLLRSSPLPVLDPGGTVRGRTPKLKPMFEDSARSVATAARGAGTGSVLCFAAALAISMFGPRLRRSAGLAGGAAVSILADAIAIVALLSESREGQRRAVPIEAGGRFRGREDLSRPAYLMAGLPRLERPGWYAGLVAETRSMSLPRTVRGRASASVGDSVGSWLHMFLRPGFYRSHDHCAPLPGPAAAACIRKDRLSGSSHPEAADSEKKKCFEGRGLLQ